MNVSSCHIKQDHLFIFFRIIIITFTITTIATITIIILTYIQPSLLRQAQ